MDEFPVTVTGKIRRRDLREREIQRLTLKKKGPRDRQRAARLL